MKNRRNRLNNRWKERKKERERRTKKGGSLGTRKLEMITHLLNLGSPRP